jgi:signal transduction histidine kinase
MQPDTPIEPGLIRIFRFFTIAETIAFLFVPLGEWLVTGSSSQFYTDPFYIIFLQALFLSIYLSIPWLQHKLRQAYLLLALLFAILVPSIVVNIDMTLRIRSGQEIELYRLWALLPILMIPLVPTAWQYTFRTVLLLFTSLGLIEAFYLIFLNRGLHPELLMPLFAIFIRLTTLSLVGLMITDLMQTQREQRKELMRANLRIGQQALVQQQLAVSHERNRLARELHDTLAHTLSGLSVQLEALHTIMPPENPEINEMIETALQSARNGLQETRRALKALRAEPVENMGLLLALQNLTQTIQQRSSLQIYLNIPETLQPLTPEEEQIIYRTTQESLENIIRHAQANHAWITFDSNQALEWLLEIRDDGKGFNPQQANQNPDHMGLRGLRERSDSIRAQFEIHSTPNQGTLIRLYKRGKP